MSERPGFVFGGLIAATGLLGTALAAGLAALGGTGIAGLATTVAGALTACVFFLAELRRVPLTSLVLVGFALASASGFARASLVYRRGQRLLQRLPYTPMEEGPFAAVAEQAGVVVVAIPAQHPEAFCFGLLRPRIAITNGLLERLRRDELEAVIWHEAQHVRAREPLRCLLARLAASTFFWIPALDDLFQRYLLAKELDADRAATARTSQRALAGALHEVIAQPAISGGVGLADLAAARVNRLFDPEAALPPLFRRRRLALSVIAVALLGLVLAFPANLDFGEQARMHSMLTSMSLHGLPGMAIGLALNGVVVLCVASGVRRLAAVRQS